MYPDEMFIDGHLFYGGQPGMCYMKIFNMGDPDDEMGINKRNAWVFGKTVLTKWYMIFDASIKHSESPIKEL